MHKHIELKLKNVSGSFTGMTHDTSSLFINKQKGPNW